MLAFLAGLALIGAALISVIRIFVLPRGARDFQARAVMRAVRVLFNLAAARQSTFDSRDRVMALYAPIGLLSLLGVWLVTALLGYSLLFWSFAGGSYELAVSRAGSALFTLGFAAPSGFPMVLLSFTASAVGLVLIALLISYLPTMYSAFSQREQEVTMLAVRAGTPPSAVEMINRYCRLQRLDRLGEVWFDWEHWFANLEETHTSLAMLAFFRSPQPRHSWVTAAGAVLDAASLTRAAVDIPADPQADLCIRAGYIALRTIASYFQLAFNDAPDAGDPISIDRSEFEEALATLAAGGVPLKPDREQAWRDFAGWRVNYDGALLALTALTMAPYAPWSSDRGLAARR